MALSGMVAPCSDRRCATPQEPSEKSSSSSEAAKESSPSPGGPAGAEGPVNESLSRIGSSYLLHPSMEPMRGLSRSCSSSPTPHQASSSGVNAFLSTPK